MHGQPGAGLRLRCRRLSPRARVCDRYPRRVTPAPAESGIGDGGTGRPSLRLAQQASPGLDLFAVLLGGAVALLPVFAQDILGIGAAGLGVLRSAPAVGAVVMAILVAHWPLRRNAGTAMLWCVAGFGLCTIVFGLSRNLILSLAALALTGALDMVSIIVRQTMVQLATPDDMRGRVSAVNMIFVGASNEVGQFESGLTAQWFGAAPSVILGGAGTILVVALWAWLFPALRRAQSGQAPPE
jgi:predicted MFS family arabinose efflux permease